MMGRRDEALLKVRQAAKLARDKGQVPKEIWGRLELAVLIDREDYQSALTVAERLASDHPNSRNLKMVESLQVLTRHGSDQKSRLDALNQMRSQDTRGGSKVDTTPRK